MTSISIVVITKNEERNIERFLESAVQITDDIIVIDAESIDNTVSIAKIYNAQCFTKSWTGYSDAKNLGISKAKYEWILSLDADEILSDALIQELNHLQPSSDTVYEMLWHTIFCGKTLKYTEMKPKWHKRLFEKKSVKWNNAKVHEKLIIPPNFTIKKLKGVVNHYSYQDEKELALKTENYAQLAAKQLFEKKIEHTYLKKQFAPIFRFFKSYILQLGILEGKVGFQISHMSYKTAKLRYKYLKQLKNKS